MILLSPLRSTLIKSLPLLHHVSCETIQGEFLGLIKLMSLSTYKIHYLTLTESLQRGTLPKECPKYDTKQFDGVVPVMLELWGMQSTPSLPSLPGLLWLREVALDRVLYMGQIELNCVLMQNWIAQNRTVFDIETVPMLNWIFLISTVWLNWIAWNRNVFDN